MHNFNYIFKKNFTILLPPPNITGEIHIGHFYQYFIIDFILKWKLIQGYKIDNIIGFDHAGISAILKFKKKKKIINFIKKFKINFFKKMYFINFLLKKKNEFTLNKFYKKNTIKIFIFLLNNNIIYIKKKLVNFDLKIKSTLSDIEITKKYYRKFLFYIKYKIENKKYIYIPTTDLKSILFNTAIIVKNKIKCNKKFIFSPFKKKIIIIKKDFKNKFNKIKISPICNNKDFLFSIKNNIEIISIHKKKIKLFRYNNKINKFLKNKKIINYKINNNNNLKNKILKYLILNNYIICIKKIKSFLNINKKNNCKISFLLIDQWYLKLKNIFSIKKIINKLKIFPYKYFNLIKNWVLNISDWCISRQINWGLKIPIILDKENNIYLKKQNRFLKYKKNKEVFDTWFNSSIWSIYIYIKNKKKQNILISGFDIVFFWIIKMIIINILCFKKIIFKKIFLHGVIKDYKNRKISKSHNNSIPYNKLKKKINSYKNFFLKNFNNQNIKYFNFKKIISFIKIKKKTLFNIFFLIKNFFFFKFNQIKNINNFNFILYNNNINKNFLSKKIYLIVLKINFPIKNKIFNKNWNYTINYFLSKKIINFFYIIKINNKYYFVKNNYFVIFYKINFIIYVKQKNFIF